MTSRTKTIFTLAILALAIMLMACAAVPYGAQRNQEMIDDIHNSISVTLTAEAGR